MSFLVVGLGLFAWGWLTASGDHFSATLLGTRGLAWGALGLAIVAIGMLQLGGSSVRQLRARLDTLETLVGVEPLWRHLQAASREVSSRDPSATGSVDQAEEGLASAGAPTDGLIQSEASLVVAQAATASIISRGR